MSLASAQVRQNGQALAELLAGAAVLVPLCLLIPLLGKIGDINQTAIEATRYAAWERTVSDSDQKSAEILQSETQRRFFEAPDALIKSNEQPLGLARSANPLWSGSERSEMLVSASKSVGVSVSQSSDGGLAGAAALNAINSIKAALGGKGGDPSAQLEAKGMTTAALSVDVLANPLRFSVPAACEGNSQTNVICIQRKNVILTDAWDAGSPEQVKTRTEDLVPAALFRPLMKYSDEIKSIPLLKEFSDLEPGYIAPDAVPTDRLSGN